MTEQEKERIKNLRLQGLTYAEISERLSVNVSAIKTFCFRNNITPHRCRQCGVLVPQTPHRKQKLFCSTRCRMTWWNHHPEAGIRNPHHMQVCPNCHKEFACYREKHRIYCSRECYVQARRKGNRNGKSNSH